MGFTRARVGSVLLMFGLITVLVIVTTNSTLCFDHKDCRTCTHHKTWSNGPCRWCPLDNACHAKWSLKNPCLSRQNLKHPSLCKRTEYRTEYSRYFPKEAYELALFSAIAYSDEPKRCLHAIFQSADYRTEAVFSVECDDYLFDYKKQCTALIVVSMSKREIIVAYRGSRGLKQVFEEVLTIMTIPKAHSVVGGKTQHYFENVHKKLYDQVQKRLEELLTFYPSYKIRLTGHSLGGAVASITSAALVKDKVVKAANMFLYTYGMPRVGNKEYAEKHGQLVPNSWRVVQEGDKITRLPRCIIPPCSLFNGPYHHGRKVLYTDNNMSVNSSYFICAGNDDSDSKCLSRRNKRGTIMKTHKSYFGIPIGTYCINNVLKDM